MSDDTDIQDHYEAYEDEPDEPTDADDAGGTTPRSLTLPDQAPLMELVQQMASLVSQEVDRERKQLAMMGMGSSQNESGDTLFARRGVDNLRPIQICQEKSWRGRIVITALTDATSVYIGLHAGIRPGGTDTVTILGSATPTDLSRRTIRTRQALWAIGSADAVIDIQEEFG